MRIEGMRDAKWPRYFTDEDEITATADQYDIDPKTLVNALLDFQDAYTEQTNHKFNYRDQAGGLFRFLRQNPDLYVLKETEDHISILTSRDNIHPAAADELTYSRDYPDDTLDAVLDHHHRTTYSNHDRKLSELIGALRPSDQLLTFTRPDPEDLPEISDNYSPAMSYSYTSDALVTVTARWVGHGESGRILFEQEWDGYADGTLTLSTTADNMEVSPRNGGAINVYENDHEFPPEPLNSEFLQEVLTSDQRTQLKDENPVAEVNPEQWAWEALENILTPHQMRAALCDAISQRLFSERPLDYDNAVDEGMTCEMRYTCESAKQCPDGGVYVMNDEVHTLQNHNDVSMFDNVCTDCFMAYVSNVSTLTERQSHILSYYLLDFSHARITKELNKQAPTEDDEVTRGAVSGALDAIKKKRKAADRTVLCVPEKMYTGM